LEDAIVICGLATKNFDYEHTVANVENLRVHLSEGRRF
jgi:hypothetical protein